MKKLILSLFLFCSVFAFSQGTIPIPQIIGLPAALASKVDKVTGKSLVTDTSIVKLTGVQAGAQVNKIEGIQKNGADLTITGKKVNITIPTTASDISAEPANTNIQSHISSTSNPHSVTKSQVGLGNVDNTSDINKPISTATQTALDGKQLIGTYATGTGTANGTNTGDETLTSIKTKLGAATSVSDGYLKYQDFVRFDGKQPAGAYLTAEIDGSTTNELNSSSAWDNATNTISITDAGGAKSVVITGFLESEVDGSIANELQTISTTGAAGNITLSNSGGTLNLNVNDADASTTNEIQDLSLSGNTLSLSSDATTVDVSQATAVLANTAKVSNATHTGDVTGSTALTLATVNSNIGTFNNVTINAKGLATAGSNVSYEPSFSKNTAFNKNFGTTTGTVLEGRTFGTAANSSVGDFIQNQNSSAQTANIWINSPIKITADGAFDKTLFDGTVNRGNTTAYNLIDVKNLLGTGRFTVDGTGAVVSSTSITTPVLYAGNDSPNGIVINRLSNSNNNSINFNALGFSNWLGYASGVLKTGTSADINGSGNVIYHSGNLTSSLTTNYIPKWNGSRFVNSLVSDDGISDPNAKVYIDKISGNYAWFNRINTTANTSTLTIGTTFGYTNEVTGLSIYNGIISIPSTIASTTSTTGALVVNGGVGANHVRANQFYGNGSNLTGVQLPITLTTNGTSGAATFENGVMNVPNYASTGTGGEFTSNYTNISNTTLSTSTLATYTNINGIINASVFGAVTSTASGKCTFRVSVPATIRSGRCAVVSGVESGKTTSANIFIEGTGSTYVDISFIASTSSSILEFKMITMGY